MTKHFRYGIYLFQLYDKHRYSCKSTFLKNTETYTVEYYRAINDTHAHLPALEKQ